ncbi:MAG: glycosyltransferase family 4 protein [Chloroflexi bacterium]|nr:glycosyltransferase family 4 protein [Chloroflexota bacterium]
MRVIYCVGTRFAGGGFGDTAYQSVRGIHARGHLKRLLASSYRPTEVDARLIRSLGILGRALRKLASYDPTGRVYRLHDLLFERWAARQVEPCDVFHGWNGYSLSAMRRARALGAVIVVERASSHISTQKRLLAEEQAVFGHGGDSTVPEPVLRRCLQEYEAADCVLVPSQFAYQSFLELGFPEEKLKLLPFGVDLERFRPAAQEPEIFRVLYVGQLTLRKGVPYLLRAWRELDLAEAELVLVGVPGPRDREWLSSLRTPSVQVYGYTPDLPSHYRRSSVFVFPSIEEGSAQVTYEALAAGLPVVTTFNAGSLVRDGIEGFIVPIRDVQGLKDRLRILRERPELRQEMRVAARRWAEQYPWHRRADGLLALYQDLVARRHTEASGAPPLGQKARPGEGGLS